MQILSCVSSEDFLDSFWLLFVFLWKIHFFRKFPKISSQKSDKKKTVEISQVRKKLTEKVDIHKKQIHYVDLWNVIFGIHFLYLKLLASATFRSINALASTQLPKYIFKNCIILYMSDYIRRPENIYYVSWYSIRTNYVGVIWDSLLQSYAIW